MCALCCRRIPVIIVIWCFAALLVVLRTDDVRAQGYHVEGDRIVVEGEDWEAWTQPEGVLEKDDAGGIRPHFVHAPINACLNAADFGATHKGGSNVDAIPYVMDGDLSTYWEPADGDPLEDYWVQMDLGRGVTATKLVLRFVEERRGDPFLRFKVEISNGRPLSYRSSKLYFKRIWATTRDNEDQRYFAFELSLPSENGLDPVPGDAVRYVRVRMLDTRGDRREEISADAYSALSPQDRGAVDYFRITDAGNEAPITPEEYASLAPQQKGPVRYYRRERPRLAEVEVWSLGENLILDLVRREGSARQLGTIGLRRSALDGDYATTFRMTVKPEPEAQNFLLLDLGSVFWVDTILLTVIPFHPYGYRMQVCDRAPDAEGHCGWTTVTPESRWEDTGGSRFYEVASEMLPKTSFSEPFTLHHVFPPSKVRVLKLSCRYNFAKEDVLDIWEWQVFGKGYVPEIVLTSGLIDVGPVRQVTAVDWEGDTPPSTRIEVQTRTGDQAREEKHYFDKDGVEVSAYRWYKLPGFMQGPIEIGYGPGGPGWSPWSRVVEYPGARFESPNPRRYLQARVRLVSDDPHQCAVLRSLSFPLETVLVKQAVGQLSPDEVQRAGIPEVFSLQLHPGFRPSDPGFDQILIKTSPGVKMELVEVNITQKGQMVPLTDSLTVHPTSDDSLWIQFPTVIRSGGPEEIEIRFRSAIYRDATLFDVFLKHHAIPGSWQQVDSEVSHPFLRTFAVYIPTTDRGVMNVEITPRSFTPNGDGVHDETTIRFTLASVHGPKRPVVTIYNLRGQSVRHLSAYREQAAGAYTLTWDGRDDEGELVPPGGYLVRVEVHTKDTAARDRSKAQRVYVIY